MTTPVLFIIFNRPDTTRIVFDAIRKAQPKYLYVAADGPREGNQADAKKCKEVRDIINTIDWDCEVRTLFRDENLGCNMAVTGGISWFFENVEEGIILEDDCLPHEDFWGYCTELLEKYRNVGKVKMISGDNFQNGNKRGNASYYFSALSHIWGWATWKRAWKEYDYDIAFHLSKAETSSLVYEYFPEKDAQQYWIKFFQYIKEGRSIAWDARVTFSAWKYKGVSIIPNVNLVTNIGFGVDATHAVKDEFQLANIIAHPILPLMHPDSIKRDVEADRYYYEHSCHNSLDPHDLRQKIEELIPWKIRKRISRSIRSIFKK